MKPIIFTDVSQELPFLERPKPASASLPDWYKKMPGYFGKLVGGKQDRELFIDNDGLAIAPQTIKRCIPVFDAMTSGYILHTLCDVQVTQRDGHPFYTWSQNYDVVMFHNHREAPGVPGSKTGVDFPKWKNPWAIKTPAGYSSLIVPPLNNQNNMFEIFSAIVDTDTYVERIHLPFKLLDWNWEGIIPAGTPMAQIVPFKRDSFELKIGGQKEREESLKVGSAHRRFFYNAYRNMRWNKKFYK